MKNFKKILLTGTITLATLITMSITSNAAAKVKVTGDTINVRKGASTSTEVVAMLSKGVECEYLGEEGDWYKVKYQRYTGYVSKQYAELIGDTSDSSKDNDSKDTQTDNKDNNQVADNTQQDNKDQDNTKPADDTSKPEESEPEEVKIVTKKFNQNTAIKLLPLIHSSEIGNAKNNEEITVLAEAAGWTYVQTNTISGWVRSDTLGEAKTTTSTTKPTSTNTTNTTTAERTGYISEDTVNMRKGAGTNYSIIKVLKLNTEVTITGEDGNWYKVKSGSSTGYVSKDYVSDTKKVTSRSLSTPRTPQENEDEDEKEEKTSSNTENKTTTTNNKTTTTSKNTSSTTTDKKTSTSTTTTSKTDNKTTSSTTSNKNTTTATTNDQKDDSKIKGTDVVAYAKKYLGHKYVYGGDGSNGTFDCSGFTMYVYNHFGIKLPHSANAQYKSGKGTKISKQSDLKAGDIVFLTDYSTGVGIGHCGIYIGNGDFIHASTSGYKVTISSLNNIYVNRFYAGLRLI